MSPEKRNTEPPHSPRAAPPPLPPCSSFLPLPVLPTANVAARLLMSLPDLVSFITNPRALLHRRLHPSAPPPPLPPLLRCRALSYAAARSLTLPPGRYCE